MAAKRDRRGGEKRAEVERRKLLMELTPYLAKLRKELATGNVVSIEGVARGLGVSKQTLYTHKLTGLIEEVIEEQKAAKGRVRKARPGARARIAALTAERDQWRRQYDALLDEHTRLLDAVRTNPSVDLLAILRAPLWGVDRSEPRESSRHGRNRNGSTRRHLRAVE